MRGSMVRSVWEEQPLDQLTPWAGSTVTIVALIFVLLLLIIIFKT